VRINLGGLASPAHADVARRGGRGQRVETGEHITCVISNHLMFIKLCSLVLSLIIHLPKLAALGSQEEKYGEALENLEQARRVASKEGFTNELKRILCQIGIVKGSMRYGAFCDSLAAELRS